MADSQQKVDWGAARGAALDCLNATWDIVCWAERSQEDDYDEDGATLHLTAIDRARDTFRRALEVLQPGLGLATDESIRYSPVFDAMALATIGEGARPAFQVGDICSSTAHELAFILLRHVVFWLENSLAAQGVNPIGQLHELSPKVLIKTLRNLTASTSHYILDRGAFEVLAKMHHLGSLKPIESLLTREQYNVFRSWIDREWAAVSHAPAKDNKGGVDGVKMSEPLTRRAQAVYDYIVAEGPVVGRQITHKTGIDQSTLTKEIIPELKELRGIINKRGAGYYSPAHYSPH